MRFFLLIISLISFNILFAQNFGVGTSTPIEKLDVIGNSRANGLIITIGGAPFDFLVKNNASGELGFRKGHGALGINYIICLQGIYPPPQNAPSSNPSEPNSIQDYYLGALKIMAGRVVPAGWALCDGRLLSISQNTALFSLLGTTYGGNGITNYALPDLRGAVPVGQGTNPAGYSWLRGQKSDTPIP